MRKRAAELRRLVDLGGDPLQDLEDRRSSPSVVELAARFEQEELGSRAPRTADDYRALLRKHIIPAIGASKVASVTRDDIATMHAAITATGAKRRANAALAVASVLFAAAVRWRLRLDNPCRDAVKRHPEPHRERQLSPPELERLMATLSRWRPKRCDSVDLIRLLLLCGSRRSETAMMRWSDVVGSRHLVQAAGND